MICGVLFYLGFSTFAPAILTSTPPDGAPTMSVYVSGVWPSLSMRVVFWWYVWVHHGEVRLDDGSTEHCFLLSISFTLCSPLSTPHNLGA